MLHDAAKDAECLVCQVRRKKFTGAANGNWHGVAAWHWYLANELKALAGGGWNTRPFFDAASFDIDTNQFEGALGVLQNLDEDVRRYGMGMFITALDVKTECWISLCSSHLRKIWLY